MCLVGIGFLGLVPFGTAFAFFRNGLRALRTARADRSQAVAFAVVSVLGMATVAAPLAAQASVGRRTQEVLDAALAGDPVREAEAASRLKAFGWLADPSEFVAAHQATRDPVRQERLSHAWHEATGRYLQTSID